MEGLDFLLRASDELLGDSASHDILGAADQNLIFQNFHLLLF
jgi:hypothetical protein